MLTYHNPVLLHECLEGLQIRRDGKYVDVTFGGGGHSGAILEKLGTDGMLIAFDRDEDAAANVPDDKRFIFVQQNFTAMKDFLVKHNHFPVDGILADLGISSHQIDEASRGFSTRFEGPLDMRMDQRMKKTAADVLNEKSEKELKQMFSLYGEVENAGKLSRIIVHAREEKNISTISDLKTSITSCTPKGKENSYLARVFQALRIEVNQELEALKLLLRQSADVLKPGGRIAVIAYHSLEDRLVKNFFRSGNFEGELEKDIYGNIIRPFEPVNRKPITPGEKEIEMNNRARSAKLRIAKRSANAAAAKAEYDQKHN